jgi:hypothetical protein
VIVLQDPEIRTVAIRSLSSWPSDEPLKDLCQVITETDDEKQKIIALRGYIHLIGLKESRESLEKVTLYNDAIQLAWRAEEKKLVLAGYSQVHHSAALKAVEGVLINSCHTSVPTSGTEYGIIRNK